jgi:radical SAM additional 4Fe4S-binding domain
MISTIPYIHTFLFNGKYFLIDFNKSVFSKIDEVTYKALQHDETANRNSTFVSVSPAASHTAHPHEIVMLVDQECNLACDYCYAGKGEYGNKGKMTEETARRAIDYILEKPEKAIRYHIGFFGGEPLLNFSVMKMAAEYADSICSRKGISISFGLTTNGTILNDEILEFLKKYHVSVKVSMDGPKEIHDRYRKFANGSGSFDTIVSNLQEMIATLPEGISALVTLTEQSPRFDEIESYLKEVGFCNVISNHVSEYPTCKGSYHRKGVKPIVPANSLEDELKTFLERHSRDRIVSTYKDMQKSIQRILKTVRYYNCSVGSHMIAIGINGDIYPCQRFVGMTAFKIGNVHDGLVETQYAKFFNDFEATREACDLCWARTICGRGCFRDAVKDARFCEPDEQMCNQRRNSIEKMFYLYSEISDYCVREGYDEKGKNA